MEVKTSELIGPALNWAVAKCEHNNKRYKYGEPCFDPNTRRIYETQGLQQIGVCFSPITNWSQCGPIIERERLWVFPDYGVGRLEFGAEYQTFSKWKASRTDKPYWVTVPMYDGPTPLIAAMRCYVASKLGDVVDIPSEVSTIQR